MDNTTSGSSPPSPLLSNRVGLLSGSAFKDNRPYYFWDGQEATGNVCSFWVTHSYLHCQSRSQFCFSLRLYSPYEPPATVYSCSSLPESRADLLTPPKARSGYCNSPGSYFLAV